ncbi:MAG: hypothetical protein M1406_08820 [Nitrospirae bacterium]|nr:hypothetical protein [Nitrospirota bacterium]
MRKQIFIFLMVMVFTFVFANPYAESQEPSKPPIVIAVDGLAFREITINVKTIQNIEIPVEPLKAMDKEPNGYLAGALRESKVFKSMNAEIKPYTWSRDPGDTKKVVPDLKTNIVQAYEVAKNEGRPLIIVAHSWGSVLAHEALSELAKGKTDDLTDERVKGLAKKGIKVDKLITMGSPLGAERLTKIPSETRENFPSFIEKPKNIEGAWINYWAKGDLISGRIDAANNIQIDKGQEPSPLHPIENTKKWHKEYFMPQGADWKRDDSFKSVYVDKDGLVVDPGKGRLPVPTETSGWLDDAGVKSLTEYSSVTEYDSAQFKKLSNMLEEKLETAPKEKEKDQSKDKSKETTEKTAAIKPTSSSKESDKAKTEEPKPAVAKKGDTAKTDSLVIKKGEETPTIVPLEAKKETPSASPAEKPQVTVTPKPASPSTAKSDGPKISEIQGAPPAATPQKPVATPAPKTQQTLDEAGKTLGKVGGTLKQLPQSIKTQSPSQKQETLQTLDALKQKLMQLSDVLKQMQNESAKKQAISTAIPAAKFEAIRITNLPPTLPPGLPKGKVADKDNLTGRNQIAGQDKLTPTKVEFTQTYDGLFTQAADAVGSRYGSHSGSLTDGTRVNVIGDSRAGDFTGSFSGRTILEPGYTPATHNNSAFSGESVGRVSAKGFKEGDLKGSMTVTVPAGTQTVRVTGGITIKTDGSLSMPNYSGPVTDNATGNKVGTMTGSWSQSKTR